MASGAFNLTDSSLFIAVDFGTTYSGFSFAVGKNSTDIIVQPEANGKKVPTRLLLKPDGSLQAFGDAVWDFYENLDEEDAERYFLFDRFKMTLQNDKEVSGETPIKASNCDKIYPAKIIFARSLQYFYETAKKRLVTALIGGDPEKEWARLEKEVTWIITVPAIWGDRAKQFMTEAAIEAGMGTESTKEKVLIELEPEGAALSCRDDLQLVSRKLGHPQTLRYMVVDCGGGTIDVTVHDLDRDTKKINEVYQATGGDWGGTAVDKKVREFIERLIGENVAAQLSDDDWLELTRIKVEEAKHKMEFGLNQVNIFLPPSFFQKIASKGCNLSRCCAAYDGVAFRSKQCALRFDYHVFEGFFQEALDNIMSHVRGLLRLVQEVDCILVVGGFAESPFLFNTLRKEFESDRLSIIRPNNASLSILKGAVMYGQNPDTIETRISKCSYGIRTRPFFDPKKHDISKKITIAGRDYCEDVFEPIIEAGQPVKIGQLIERTYKPNQPDQRAMTIGVYCVPETVKYTTGLDPLVNFVVPLSNARKGFSREVRVQMDFSRTKLHFSAKDVDSDTFVQTRVDFFHK